MARLRYQRAVTMIELLISLAIGATLSVITFRILLALSVGSTTSAYSDNSLASARWGVDSLADHLRNAQVCATAANSALASGTASSFAYYTDNNCNKVTYSLSGTNLVRTSGTTTTPLVSNVSSLAFTYLKATAYDATWGPTTSPSAPTTAELPFVCGVTIDLTVTRNGMPSRINTTVRIRNAPAKP